MEEDFRPKILLSDTVGFIKNLPHELVAAFRSTLSTIRDADLLLHVIDASSDFEDHICKCGTKKCVGYILSDDDWPKLKKELKKKK